MSKTARRSPSPIGQMFKKFIVSGFVVFTFVAYVIHQRFSNPDSPINIPIPTQTIQPLVSNEVSPTNTTTPTDVPAALPTESISASLYKDGTYAGPVVDAYYGLVKVQATIQNGTIKNVQFLQYPSDRRTSVRINSIAMPWLQQEAIQAQTANVDLISGATLTSEAFVVSLRSALQTAKN